MYRLPYFCIALVFVLFILLFPTSVFADNEDKFYSATSFKCSFAGGVFTKIDKGEFKSEDAGKFKDIIFDSIDRKKRKARMIGNQGSTDVASIFMNSALHLIEVTDSGSINTSTIFNPVNPENNTSTKDTFFAVHSRHIAPILSSPMLSQRYGTCEIWDIDR